MLLRNEGTSRRNPWRLSLIAFFGLTTGIFLVLNYSWGAWKWLILSATAIYLLLWVASGLVTKANGLASRRYKKWIAPSQRGMDPLQLFALLLLELFYGTYLFWFMATTIFQWEVQGGYFRPRFFYRELSSGFTLVTFWYIAIGLYIVAIVGRFLLRQYSGDTGFSRRRCLETSLIVAALGSIFYVLPWKGIHWTP